ncbi:MAG: dicarboxylate/amino acid:cation symporter [Planctomycetota bacterium]
MALHWKILIGLVAGVVVGLLVNVLWTAETWSSLGVQDAGAFLAKATFAEGEVDPNADAGFVANAARFIRALNAFVGDIFLRGLRFIAVPIVLFSLIVGAASLGDISKLGRIGGKTIALYLCTTAVSITIGLVLANIVSPGAGIPEDVTAQLAAGGAGQASEAIAKAESAPDFWAVISGIIPTNPFDSLSSASMLQVVFTGLAIGLALTMLPREKAQPVINFFDAMTDVIIKIVHWVLLIAPYAVFALIVSVIADFGLAILASLAKYSLTVIAGLLVMIFGVYPAILRAFTPIKYGRFFKGIAPAQLLAFSSSSSGATMPVTMQCCEENLGISEEVTSFVVPLGATINMDGTALYQGVAAVFIAELLGKDLTIAQQLTIVLTATLASIGTAAVPSAGIIMLIIVLQQLQFTGAEIATGIAVIFGVDRILDMSRTVCNITGDCMVTSVVAAGENAIGTPSKGVPEPGEAPPEPA